MKEFETKIQELKYNVLREVAKLAYEGNMASGARHSGKDHPGPEPQFRCCIYKERAIIGDRIKLAMGGDMANPRGWWRSSTPPVTNVLSPRWRWGPPAGAVWPTGAGMPALWGPSPLKTTRP